MTSGPGRDTDSMLPNTSEATQRSFDDLIAEAESHPTGGWGFSWLGTRFESCSLPWDFEAMVGEHARRSPNMLDMGTGGGEWLSALPYRPPHTVATESWPPNVPIARERLGPLGIDVVEVESAAESVLQEPDEHRGSLPFQEGSLHLITNRHETFVAREMARVLAPGGHFLTQQLGDGLFGEFRRLFDVETLDRPPYVLSVAKSQLEEAGLRITNSGEGEEVHTFCDVGALAWYLKTMPWTVPGFSISKYRTRLRELDEQIREDGPLSFRLPGFYLEAVKGQASVPEGTSLDPESAAYANDVTHRLEAILGDSLVGVYLHGSGVLGDFSRERSDIDILAVAEHSLSDGDKRAVARQLSSASLPSPAGGLEFHIVESRVLSSPVDAPPFELHIATDRSGAPDRVVDGRGRAGDPDLVMHFAVLSEHGHALAGPPASEIFPQVGREQLIQAFAGELQWAREHASPSYQVLNAARAWRFIEENVLCSKLEGGEWARRRNAYTATVDAAIKHREGQSETQPDATKAGALLQDVLRRLDASRASGRAGP